MTLPEGKLTLWGKVKIGSISAVLLVMFGAGVVGMVSLLAEDISPVKKLGWSGALDFFFASISRDLNAMTPFGQMFIVAALAVAGINYGFGAVIDGPAAAIRKELENIRKELEEIRRELSEIRWKGGG